MPLLPAAGQSEGLRAVAAAVALVALIAMVVTVIARHEWEDMLRRVQTNADTVSHLLADHTDRLLETADLVRYQAEQIVGDVGPLVNDRAAHDTLRRLIGISPHIVSIWVGDAQGGPVLTTREFPAPQLDIADRDYFTAVRDDPDHLYVGNLLDNRYAAGQRLVITSRRLSGPDGELRGFVVVSLDPVTIRQTFQHIDLGYDASLWWIGPDGQPLIREPPLPRAQLRDQAPPGYENWPQSTRGPVRGVSGIDGQQRLFFWSQSPGYANRIIIGVGHDQMVARWRTHIAPVVVFGTVLAFAGVAILWLLYRARMRGLAYTARLERDVSERTRELDRAVEQKDLILKELGHRVRNAFATILALTRQMLRTADTLEAFKQDFPARLEALAKTQVMLVDAEDGGSAQIADLAAAALAPYSLGEEQITISGPPIKLAAERSVGVGLILHELVTNAVKYGSLSVPEGTVSVTWQVSPIGVELTWREAGGPAAAEPTRFGSGIEIMARAASLIGGRLVRHFEATGVRVNLEFPANG